MSATEYSRNFSKMGISKGVKQTTKSTLKNAPETWLWIESDMTLVTLNTINYYEFLGININLFCSISDFVKTGISHSITFELIVSCPEEFNDTNKLLESLKSELSLFDTET